MNRRVLLSGIAGVAAMAAGGYYAWRESGRRAPGAALRPAEPSAAAAGGASGSAEVDLYALTLPDLEGQPLALARYRGKPLLVNFWATWCAPCVKEMPELEILDQRYPQVQFLGIGVDTAANMREFVRKVPVSYPLAVAGHEGAALVRGLGNSAGGLPFTLVFDADGSVNRRILGQIDMQDLDRTLARYAGPAL